MAIVESTSPFPPHNQRFLSIASSLTPELIETPLPALRIVQVVRDESAVLGWKAEHAEVQQPQDLAPLTNDQSFVVDFGDHLVAKELSFDVQGELEAA